jgi:uracil-DNA glycosylase
MINLKDLVGDWDRILTPVFYDTTIRENLSKINALYKKGPVRIYPEQEDVFKAFKECPYKKLSVVILLQDPYHDGSATGLATANRAGTKNLSPSLQIIKDTVCKTVYKGYDFDFDPTLIRWANQGVLLLNTALTVESGCPLSHQGLWRRFTESVLFKLTQFNTGIVYCLWGKYAEAFETSLNPLTNTILKCHHPVYASYRGIAWECDHFNQVNKYLKDYNNIIINW